jgi:hypothetical protein
MISESSDQIENGHFHRTNGAVLRGCSSPSSPSSSGAVSGSNGFEAVSNGWYSLAIKPEKMRNQKGGKRKRENRGKNQEKKDRTRGDEERQNRENFGPSTSSKSSCFYRHCLRLERRRLGRDTNKKEKPRKGEGITEPRGCEGHRKKTGEQRETKQSTKQSKEKTPKEEKNQRATQRGVLVFAIVFVPAENPESTTNSQQAGLSIIFLVSKVAEENEEETQTK